MGLTIEKLLYEYMTKEQVQDALRDIGESTSGTKDELVDRLKTNWKSYNRDEYELLDFVDKEHLQMICYYYKLDASTTSEDIYKRRIKKASLFNSKKKESSQNKVYDTVKIESIQEIPQSKVRVQNEETPKKWLSEHKIVLYSGIIIGILGLFSPVIYEQVHSYLYPAIPIIKVIEVNAKDGTIKNNNNVFEYSPRTIVPHEPKIETFSLTLLNTSDIPASNLSINFRWEPKSSWLDYGNTSVDSIVLSDVCAEKSNTCNYSTFAKELGAVRFDYTTSIDLTEYEKIKQEHPQIIITINYDNAPNPQEIRIGVTI